VAEAIDFAEFYAREILRLDQPQPLTPVHGERNSLRYLPLGVGVVIPPWNFPLAILTGMTLASAIPP
jgi:1-pyrroline-5-carboxylate dehydrogenase